MALEMVVDSLDNIEEVHKGLYVEKDGKFNLDVTGGEDVTGLKSALEKERLNGRTLTKTVKDLQTKFKGIDANLVRDMLSQADNDAEVKLIAEGKIQQVLEARLAKHQKDTDDKLAGKDETINSLKSKALENIFRAAAVKAGAHKSAIDDIILRGGNTFSLDGDNKAVQLGTDDQPVLGKDGKTNFSPSEWLEGMKSTSPHWFPVGNSGGDSHGDGDGQTGKTMTRADFDALGHVAKNKFMKDGGKIT